MRPAGISNAYSVTNCETDLEIAKEFHCIIDDFVHTTLLDNTSNDDALTRELDGEILSGESNELTCALDSAETDLADEIESTSVLVGEIDSFGSNTGEIDPPNPDLKELPSHLKYAFLGENRSKPVIISSKLQKEEEDQLVELLKENSAAIDWGLKTSRELAQPVAHIG